MDEARFWMWAKSKPPAYGDSWEEQAFAEDAAGALGGCVWPPRSYSCSFCRRDFRSAQALGGHMNVHRRDRARLKQSPNPAADIVPHASNPSTSFDPPFSSQMCTLLFSNPNPKLSDAAPISRVIRVSSPPPAAVVVHKIDDRNPPPWSSFLSEKRGRDEEKIEKPESRAEKEDCVTEELSMGLNLVASQWETNTCSEEEVGSCKRRRIEAKPLSFLVERCLPQPEVLKLCSVSDELDLELRLGFAPKVK